MRGISDIGARQYFEKADFFMPELLIKRTMSFTPVKKDIFFLLLAFKR